MTHSIDTDRSHSSTLEAKAARHAALFGTKGYASKASALRSAKLRGMIEDIEHVGLAAHFAFVEIREGRFAGRVIASLGFEAGASVPSEATYFAHRGMLVICA